MSKLRKCCGKISATAAGKAGGGRRSVVLAGSIVAQMLRWNALGEAMEMAVRSEQQPRMPFRRAG